MILVPRLCKRTTCLRRSCSCTKVWYLASSLSIQHSTQKMQISSYFYGPDQLAGEPTLHGNRDPVSAIGCSKAQGTPRNTKALRNAADNVIEWTKVCSSPC